LDDERIKQRIEELVGKYKAHEKSKSRKEMEALSEANVRADFIDPLFEILDWDVGNPKEYDREYFIGRGGGRADIALKIDNEPVALIEVKRFGGIPHTNERGDGDWLLEERQTILYAAKKDVKWAILTNFEKFRVFNALTGLTILDFESIYDYTNRFGELLYLTRDSVDSGRIERLAERKERQDIDLDFLKMLNNWRIQLANDIYQRNKDNDVLKDEEKQLDLEKLKDAVQRILDRLIIVRWAEDRLVLDDPNLLERKYHDWKLSPTYNSIVDSLFADRALFDKFNNIHDSKIFKRGHICEKVKIGDDVLGKIIHEMCQRSFRKFDFDILGNTYETYLGNTLYLKDDGTLGLKPSMETRKEAGIYYTPPYVVDYIVKNTLGELLKGKTPEDVAKIKVLDPACGSGSFLIKAFDYLNDYYEKENEKVRKRKEKLIKEYMKSSGNQLKLDIKALEHKEYKDVEKEILKNNIHGVDLDRQAAEIASVNLMLKALKPKEKLPLILDENIKVGNSLISGTEDELKQYFGDDWEEKRPFNWEEGFKDVFAQDGFDAIVGNPPYIRVQNLDPKERELFSQTFKSALGSYDIYLLFVEQAIKLLKEGSKFGFIMPTKFFQADYGRNLRKLILENCNIDQIVDFGTTKVFGEATTYPCLFFFTKTKNKNATFRYVKVEEDPSCIQEIMNKPITEKRHSTDKYEIFEVRQDFLSEKQWNFLPINKTLLFEKLKKVELTLADASSRIFQGLVTGADSIYFVNVVGEKSSSIVKIKNQFGEEFLIEKEMLRPLLKGKNIRRWYLNWENIFIIYPYELKGLNAKLYSIQKLKEEFPLTWEYFKAQEGRLKSRERGIWKNRSDWYAYGRRQNIEMFEQRKIITGVLANRASFTLDEEEKYYFVGGGNAGGYGITLNDRLGVTDEKYKYVLALLNSKLLDFYLQSISSKFQSGYFSYARRFIEQLPIKPASQEVQQQFVVLMDKMLALNKELNKVNTDFDHYVNLHPRTEDALLKHYMGKLAANDTEILKDHLGKSMNRVDGKFKEFEILEEGEWLVFKVGYLLKTKKGEMPIRNVRAFRCRIADEKLRKFLYYSIKEYTRPGKLGKGNIYERLLKIKIPQFVPNAEKNKRIIDEIMTPFLEEVAKRDKLEKEIEETDGTIDQKVYELYGLNDEEIKVIEGMER